MAVAVKRGGKGRRGGEGARAARRRGRKKHKCSLLSPIVGVTLIDLSSSSRVHCCQHGSSLLSVADPFYFYFTFIFSSRKKRLSNINWFSYVDVGSFPRAALSLPSLRESSGPICVGSCEVGEFYCTLWQSCPILP